MAKNEIKESEKGTLRLNYEIDVQIIDEYFMNGYNGTKAVMSVKGLENPKHAAVYWSNLKHKKDIQPVLDEKMARMRASAEVRQEQILHELRTFAFSDAGDYMCMTAEEIKALPPDVRRCIQSYKHKKRTYYDRDVKSNVTEESIEVRFVDKIAAIKEINKHIGFYTEDNRQRHGSMSKVIDAMSAETLNELLKAGLDSRNTIDVDSE